MLHFGIWSFLPTFMSLAQTRDDTLGDTKSIHLLSTISNLHRLGVIQFLQRDGSDPISVICIENRALQMGRGEL